MGNIFTAKDFMTPIIVVNRQFKLNEHRNDHQADGIKWMSKLKGVYTATTKDELFNYLKHKNLEFDDSISSLTSSIPVFEAASISSTSICLEFAISSQ